MTKPKFSNSFMAPLTPGQWWLVTYAISTAIRTITFKFDEHMDVWGSDRVDHIQSKIEKLNPDHVVTIMSWSRFDVEEEDPK